MCGLAAASAGLVININNIDGAFKDLSCRIPAIGVLGFCRFVPLIDNLVFLQSLLNWLAFLSHFTFRNYTLAKAFSGRHRGFHQTS